MGLRFPIKTKRKANSLARELNEIDVKAREAGSRSRGFVWKVKTNRGITKGAFPYIVERERR